VGQTEVSLSSETNSVSVNCSRHSYDPASILLQIGELSSRCI